MASESNVLDASNTTIARDQPPETAELPLGTQCARCGKTFKPRSGSGGSPQRFCSQDCRLAFHSEGQRAQRRPACGDFPVVTVAAPGKSPQNAPEQILDFDWSDTESVVLTEQPETAVYWNPHGDLVIRQRRRRDDDPIVIVTRSSLPQLIDKLTDMAGRK